MDRRSFIKRTALAGGAAGAVGAGYLGVRSNPTLATPLRPLHTLDEVAFGVLVAFAEPVLPLAGIDHRELAHGVDASLRFVAPEAQNDLNLALAVLENSLAGLVTRGGLRLFSELTVDGRAEAIHRWGDSPVAMLRGASNSLRKLLLGVHYAPLAHAEAIGYPGRPFVPPDPGPLEPRRPISKPWTPPPSTKAEPPASSPTSQDATEEEP
jgi:hypothetical protein